MKMKPILENWNRYLNEGRMPEGKLYHGTSFKQYEQIKDKEYEVTNLYLAEDEYKSVEYYAVEKAKEDKDSRMVLLVIEASLLDGELRIDPGASPDETEEDMGQWIFAGNIKNAILRAESWSEEEDSRVIYSKA